MPDASPWVHHPGTGCQFPLRNERRNCRPKADRDGGPSRNDLGGEIPGKGPPRLVYSAGGSFLRSRCDGSGEPGGLFDEASDGLWLRDVDRVAGGLLGDSRPGPLGHGPLQRRWDHVVIRRHQVPAGPPGRLTHLAIESLDAPRDLTGKFLALPGPGAKERSLSPSDDRTTDEIPQKQSPRAPPRPSVGCELGHIATVPYLRERLLPVGAFRLGSVVIKKAMLTPRPISTARERVVSAKGHETAPKIKVPWLRPTTTLGVGWPA